MGWESFGLVRFDLGFLLQGQTRIEKPKSAYNLLIIGPRSLQCETNLFEIIFLASFEKQDGCHRCFFRLSARTFVGPLQQRVL